MRVSRFITLAAVLGIAAAAPAAPLAAAPAAASPTTAQARPAAPLVSAVPAQPRELWGVSCESPASCVATGDIDDGSTDESALALTWNGKSWKTATVNLPAGASDDALDRVSCVPRARRCVAVGSYTAAGAFPALVETWNGSAWTPSAAPAPAGALEEVLFGVSCPAAKSCVAVGGYLPKYGSYPLENFSPVAESWNGVRWAPATPPTVQGMLYSLLDSVSCVSATRCFAVGWYETATGGSVLLESWNGKAWTRLHPPLPAGSKGQILTGVSCASATSCVAVGVAAGSQPGNTAFSELWNGRTWRVAGIAWPRGTGNSFLVGVSCAAAAWCVADGYTGFNVTATGHTGRAAAVSWNGKAWRVTGVPAPAKGSASLFNAVSCLSAAYCVAVGQEGPLSTTQGNGLTGFWNGKGWKLVAAP